jgi:hypothetical protein
MTCNDGQNTQTGTFDVTVTDAVSNYFNMKKMKERKGK